MVKKLSVIGIAMIFIGIVIILNFPNISIWLDGNFDLILAVTYGGVLGTITGFLIAVGVGMIILERIK